MDNEKIEKFFYGEDEDAQIVKEVIADFEQRREERRHFDLLWELNMNFVLGNQYTAILPNGEISETEKIYNWECREVYNHIAPIIETRLAKLKRVRPTVNVRPTSSEESDVYCSKLCKAIIEYQKRKLNLSKLVSEASVWSEVCGTAFYKVVWDSNAGKVIACDDKTGKKFYSGDVNISVCSPFEIFPDSNSVSDVDECSSIIHARIMPTSEAKMLFDVDVKGGDRYAYTFDGNTFLSGISGRSNVSKVTKDVRHNHCLVIEKYVKPNAEYPDGRLIIVCENKLVYDGQLPFVFGESQERGFPFVKQIAIKDVGSFWGGSVVERCIPIQRAYNAVKNRKHEYLARLTGGILAVEDGSVDMDNLEDEGLAPGKILVYRQGSSLPRYMDHGEVPYDFNREEDRLLNEFITVSGVSELMRDSSVPSSVTSGRAISLLIEQDESRLSATGEYIRESVLQICDYILKLYKQFASTERLCEITDENGDIEVYYFNGAQITNYDVVLDSVNELTESPAQRRNTILELFRLGLFHDENGKLSDRTRYKLLDSLGFGLWDYAQDERSLQVKNAIEENLNMNEDVRPSDIDDHKIHIEEHRKFMLSNEAKKRGKEYVELLHKHLVAHKNMLIPAQITGENFNYRG
ncbi:MAG: hypothetical protein IJS68_03335 [Clostridia bacterium]|nr:hypothetical protein [Clostridia bacterium]